MPSENQNQENSAEKQPTGMPPISSTPTPSPSMSSSLESELSSMNTKLRQVRDEMHKLVIGQDDYIDLLIIAMLSGGHALVEGVPGIAKTLTTKTLAKATSIAFSRIQFTPDLMPTDVVGTNVFVMKDSSFTFKQGPIFSQMVLIDEINRAPAKTQSELFEVMEEVQVTVDGKTHLMEEPFMVLATQNPIEQEGTYKLPEAQMDRFLFRILMEYPTENDEIEMLDRFSGAISSKDLTDIKPVLNGDEIMRYRDLVKKVRIDSSLQKYIAQIVQLTRSHPDLYLGASPRASLALMNTSKAMAAISGRDFVSPDDIQKVLFPVLNHRLSLTPEREMEGVTLQEVLRDIIEKTEAPR